MSTRRDNRMAAVQFLYMWDINPSDHLNEVLAEFFGNRERPRDYFAFAEELVCGVLNQSDKLDQVIGKYAENWDFRRIAKIDLAILRLAIYEMMFRRDIPPIVSINEAIDLSKIFSIDDAKRFINGILDKFKLELHRPLREPSVD